MKINDVELRTGVNSKNIRFYEKKGLLTPKRDINGYRDFSENDVKRLKEIKLFRNLGISIEELSGYFCGDLELYELLDKQINYLDKQMESIKNLQKLCHEMRCNNSIHDKISGIIFDFEDIIFVSPEIIKQKLINYNKEKLVIALMGSSPMVNQFIMRIFPNIDINAEKKKVGSIRIDVVAQNQDNIIKLLNSDI